MTDDTNETDGRDRDRKTGMLETTRAQKLGIVDSPETTAADTDDEPSADQTEE